MAHCLSLVAQDATTQAAVFGALLVAIIAVPLAMVLSIWTDEAFTLHTTGYGPVFAWGQSITFEAQPPLYFLVVSLWRMLDESAIWFARIPSICFAAVSVFAIVKIAHRVAPRVNGFAVAAITALNPIVIWAAVEMRVYSLVMLVGAMLTWTLFEGFLSNTSSRPAKCCYLAFAIIGLYTQYYVGFLLVAHFVTVFLFRRKEIWSFIGLMVIVAAIFAPFVPAAIFDVRNSTDMVAPVSFFQAMHKIFDAVFVYMLPHDAFATSSVAKIVAFASGSLLLVIVLVVGRPVLAKGPIFALVWQWALSLVIFGIVFAVTGTPLDTLRHLIVLAPASLLVVLIALSFVTRAGLLVTGTALAFFVGFTGVTLWHEYHPPIAKSGEWSRVATIVTADGGTIPVAVFAAELAVPLNIYLPVPAISIPRPMPFTLDYVGKTRLMGEYDVARVLDPIRARSAYLWIVTDGNKCVSFDPNGYNYNCRFLEAYLTHHYNLVRSVSFRGSLARLYERGAV